MKCGKRDIVVGGCEKLWEKRFGVMRVVFGFEVDLVMREIVRGIVRRVVDRSVDCINSVFECLLCCC